MQGYAGLHYLHDYDYFHIGGDDLYLIVENLRHYIATRLEPIRDKPVITGAHAKIWEDIDGIDYLLGGPGYTMNREALKRFVDIGLDRNSGCFMNHTRSEEDQLMSRCIQEKLKLNLSDSHDPITAEQIYHHTGADRVYEDSTQGKKYVNLARQYWSRLPHPLHKNQTIGDRQGFDAAHKYSVAFHFLKTPAHFARYTAILYRLCPSGTLLGETIKLLDRMQKQTLEVSR